MSARSHSKADAGARRPARAAECDLARSGFPSLLVTYGVANNYFFSGHTDIAMLRATELVRPVRPSLLPCGLTGTAALGRVRARVGEVTPLSLLPPNSGYRFLPASRSGMGGSALLLVQFAGFPNGNLPLAMEVVLGGSLAFRCFARRHWAPHLRAQGFDGGCYLATVILTDFREGDGMNGALRW